MRFAQSLETLAGAVLLLGTASASATPSTEDGGWPSAEQRAFAQQRLANFPVQTLVKDVEWYQPQEPVQGSDAPAFEPVAKSSLDAQAIAKAQELVEAKDSYAFLVWRSGQLEHEYYAEGFDRTSRFATASMAKTVVALSVGVAIDRGHIASVNDPVEKYVPTMQGTSRGKTSLRSLLQMSSGFETPSPTSGLTDVYWQYALGQNIGEAVAHWPETCNAGKEFCYANANTAMLGWVLEGATGMRYANWLSQSLWQPIGASQGRLWLDREGGWPRYSCCLHANAQDWMRVGQLLLNKGRMADTQIVSSAWVEDMLAPSPANPNYGYQVWRGSPHNPARTYGKTVNAVVVAKQPFARDDVYFLDGSAGQRVYVIPSEDMVIVRIGAPDRAWDDSELPNLLIAGL